MSKILLIGDCHLGMSYPNNYLKWMDVSKNYFEGFLIPLIEKKLDENDIIIQLGDLFDNRSLIPIDVLNYAKDILLRISKICPIHILVGNHDMFHKSSGEINSINLFDFIHNIYVYNKPSKIDWNGKSILMMPYIEKKKEQIEILKKYSGTDYLFCHSDLNGAKMHLTSVAHKNNDKIDVEEFSGYKNVYSGHLHIVQSTKNFTFVGNIFEMDRNDLGNQKGIYILDTITGSHEFIENKISPRFKKVWVRTEEDILSLDSVSTKDYIDLYISNSLLINNRKLRRKLEMMLESGNFASVEYLDDIVEKKSEEKSVIDELTTEELESGVVPSLQLEYTEIIKDYITNQKYNSEKIKFGVISEFEQITQIYNQNYKSLSE
jgi:DNA repair exonuclease SbcCD nuclease subunit